MYIVFDIGGTKTRFALSRDGETFEEPVIVPTPMQFDEAIEKFREISQRFGEDGNIYAIGGGVRGILDRQRTKLISDRDLTDWINKPLSENISDVCGVPVFLENDSALVGLGEAVVGAGKGSDIVAYVTVSTGVGGVRVVNGRIDEHGFGYEPGKQIIDPDHTLCPDCPGVSLGKHVSGKCVQERFGRPPKEITDNSVWREIARFLAVGLHNTIVHWSPNILVLGGSMVVKSPGISLADVGENLEQLLRDAEYPMPKIVQATLGDVGGLHGALIYLKQQLQKV